MQCALQRLRASVLAYRIAGIVWALCMCANGEIGMIGGVAPRSDCAGREVHGTDVGQRQFCWPNLLDTNADKRAAFPQLATLRVEAFFALSLIAETVLLLFA